MGLVPKQSADSKIQHVIKKHDDIVNNSTILRDDSELSLNLKANRTYHLTVSLFYKSSPISKLKTSFTLPTRAIGKKVMTNISPHSGYMHDLSTIRTHGTSNENAFYNIFFVGFIVTADISGALTAQFSQNMASSRNTTLFKSSMMQVIEQ